MSSNANPSLPKNNAWMLSLVLAFRLFLSFMLQDKSHAFGLHRETRHLVRSLLNCFPLPKRYSADQVPLIWALKTSSSTDAANSAPVSNVAVPYPFRCHHR